ncbi:uncharacterized protein [Oscarella lobularis]|uniref:uncharacterized protein isoform X2 n=1 Tax=Oscarella lobularis TaxID=121494 RepID=UPI0033137006
MSQNVHERLRERASAAQGQPPRVLPRPPPKTSVPTQTPNGSANQVRAAAGFVPRTFCYTNAALGRGGGSSSTPPSTQERSEESVSRALPRPPPPSPPSPPYSRRRVQTGASTDSSSAAEVTSGFQSESDTEHTARILIKPARIPVETVVPVEVLIPDGKSMPLNGTLTFESVSQADNGSPCCLFNEKAKRGFNQLTAVANSPRWPRDKEGKAKATLSSRGTTIGVGEVEFYYKQPDVSRFQIVNTENQQEMVYLSLQGCWKFLSVNGVSLVGQQSQGGQQDTQKIQCDFRDQNFLKGIAAALCYCHKSDIRPDFEHMTLEALVKLFPESVQVEKSECPNVYDEPELAVAAVKTLQQSKGLYLPSKLGMTSRTAEEILRSVSNGEITKEKGIERARDYVYQDVALASRSKPKGKRAHHAMKHFERLQKESTFSDDSDENFSEKKAKSRLKGKKKQRPLPDQRSTDDARSTATERSRETASLSSSNASFTEERKPSLSDFVRKISNSSLISTSSDSGVGEDAAGKQFETNKRQNKIKTAILPPAEPFQERKLKMIAPAKLQRTQSLK